MELRAGCSGWSYSSWVGPFFPKDTKPRDFLKLYSAVFDTVEIDSSFYRIPSSWAVELWRRAVPEGFLFSAKMPKEITHDRRFVGCEGVSDRFLRTIRLLGPKLGPVLVQLPPSYSYQESGGRLEDFLRSLPPDLQYAIEFRHASWFNDRVYALLEQLGMTLVWSEIPYVKVPDRVTASIVYLRLIGDRSIREEDFGKLQKDRTAEMVKWSERLSKVEASIRRGYVFANNHFAGFSPATVNQFMELMGRNPMGWRGRMVGQATPGQRTLLD
ncbi:MAG: DUF72 domain-containing protein [Conexivisphaerales archaeon]|jgi:uncharacterized protein YecE (DUF72 family)